jgi:cholesterol oxidase
MDGWDGYPGTFCDLFRFIANHRIRHVVFLSGDEHLPVSATASLCEGDQELTRVYSIHTSALYAPFPFANGSAEDLVLAETLSLGDGLLCKVNTTVHTMAFGFTLLRFSHEADGWVIHGCYEGSGETFVIRL